MWGSPLVHLPEALLGIPQAGPKSVPQARKGAGHSFSSPLSQGRRKKLQLQNKTEGCGGQLETPPGPPPLGEVVLGSVPRYWGPPLNKTKSPPAHRQTVSSETIK